MMRVLMLILPGKEKKHFLKNIMLYDTQGYTYDDGI